jgi:hypothetical protein
MIGMLIQLIIVVASLAGFWKMFEKMGKPGWNGIVPIYNLYILTQILGKPVWWIVLGLIPFVNIVLWIPVAERFGKSAAFGVGLALLPFVFALMLGFGDAQYSGATPASPAIPT